LFVSLVYNGAITDVKHFFQKNFKKLQKARKIKGLRAKKILSGVFLGVISCRIGTGGGVWSWYFIKRKRAAGKRKQKRPAGSSQKEERQRAKDQPGKISSAAAALRTN